ncbi:LLM class flavin-dependent oxidoreductase [Kibdelosporangium philippinense]|uniref:LLM class flavin-dependent oxidoreductase n=1 Tax=Kibdelosporangium philippinense TaxID=211113 RepID=A0ABS8Z5M5_9PSEU|nr:LLM class flavin-dependent oxidoreductase [Kibdelosporangium philippinense]MCE7003186.1 LLM class flavin-dependent oxidoreductase [Kibdelosporangium philippinense]
MTVRLSILDQSPIPEGGTAAEALQSSVDTARAAEGLGIARYWVAEHHNSPGFAGTAPEILAGAILANTRTMRVGSGGVLLPRYTSDKVIEVFRVLSALYPGRVDLGVGRAGGPAGEFPQQVSDIVRAMGPSDVWLLGSSGSSAGLAARLGTGFAFAHFLNPAPGVAALDAYTSQAADPRGALALRVVAADTASKAIRWRRVFCCGVRERTSATTGRCLRLPPSARIAGRAWSWSAPIYTAARCWPGHRNSFSPSCSAWPSTMVWMRSLSIR